MAEDFSREPMMDMFIFETSQLTEQLEQIVINSEKSGTFNGEAINEVFRIMHTIKGSSAMMMYKNMSSLAHAVEDLFYYLRESKPENVDYSGLTDIVLEAADFIKLETAKLESGYQCDGDAEALMGVIRKFLSTLKENNNAANEDLESQTQKLQQETEQKYYIAPDKTAAKGKMNSYKANAFFDEGCEMENIRTFAIIHNLKEIGDVVYYYPEDIIDNDSSVDVIRKEGFIIIFSTEKNYDEVQRIFEQVAFLRNLDLKIVNDEEKIEKFQESRENVEINTVVNKQSKPDKKDQVGEVHQNNTHHSLISVNVQKLDKLMDLVGELVISEAMVTQNPDLNGLPLDNFYKAARQLRKIAGELQDIVMSIRMVPLSMTFQKMNRIVRDTSKKLDKEVELKIIGEETEVDKNIIDHISDPLMHLIRNSIDHGIESTQEREMLGKSKAGCITLEAKNAGGDVWIIVQDDGKGLNRDKILEKARKQGLVHKPESELTDADIYSFIFLPGFSTKDSVTELSGRGVGMDVVVKNVESIGGSVLIDSTIGEGTTISIKIPLTLAIIDGMTIRVGNSRYTIPMTSIKESFKVKDDGIITDPEGNEMILIRGQCYPILRLHEIYKVKTKVTNIFDGIVIMIENDSKFICIFADELLGQQQVVVKALPSYIKRVNGIAGCTLLGDGSISLILDVSGLFSY